MTKAPPERANHKPDRDELIRRAQGIAAVVKARAARTEADRRVAGDVIDLVKRAELFRILQPASFGGYEYGFDLFVEVAATIAAGCPSSGWVSSIGMAHQWLIALFPLEAQRQVWQDDSNAIAFGSYAPTGKITAAESGYVISGRWSFASGCDNAQWLVLGALLQGAEKPAPAFLLVDAGRCSIEDDWQTIGLAGTGSKTVVANDVVIPRHAVVGISELAAGDAPGARIASNPLYKIPLLAVLPLCLVAPAMGMARGALAAFVDSAQSRVTRGAIAGGNNRMAEFATVQLRVAEAAASIDAGRQLLLRDIADVQGISAAGGRIDVDMRIRNRRDHAFCTRLFIQAVDALFQASGGTAIYSDKMIQQYWRDIHAAGVHISLNWDAVGTMYGQHALGLEPKGQF